MQGYAEIVADPQVKHMKSLVTVAGAGETGAPVTLVNHPVLYDGETAEVRLPPQPLGAQTAEVLKELGLGGGRDRGARQGQGGHAPPSPFMNHRRCGPDGRPAAFLYRVRCLIR